MKRIISFSIWGDNKLYTDGVLANLKLAPIIYRGWTPRIYVDSKVAISNINKMQRLGAEVVEVINDRGPWYGLFWRFLPAGDPTIERFISRDADSRLNVREKAAVDEWMKSKLPFHIMRDHRNHDTEILGGMWGCNGGFLPDIEKQIAAWSDTTVKGCDQKFLARIIWPIVKDQHIGHDEFYPSRYGGPVARKFPPHLRFNGKHVGEVIK